MKPDLAYEDGVIKYTVYVNYDVALRNQILQVRNDNILEFMMKEYNADSHCFSYCIYEYGKLIHHWMRGET